MSDKLKKLIDERGRAWDEAKNLGDIEDRTAEQTEQYGRALTEVERLAEAVETEERAQKLAGVMDAIENEPTPVPVERTGDDRAAKYRDAFYQYVRSGEQGVSAENRLILAEGARAQSSTANSGADGGYLIPDELYNKMTEAMKAFGGIRSVANVLSTSSGNPMHWPTADDTTNKGSILGENTVVPDANVTFGQETLGAFTYVSGLFLVPWTLLQDEVFNLESYLGNAAGVRIARAVSDHLATGNGTSQPQGLFSGATVGKESASASAVTFDELIDLEHSIDPAYRGGNTNWVFNDTTLQSLRKLKDNDDNYLWQPSTREGQPSTILGRPYVIDQGVPSLGGGERAVGFGDVSAAFLVREVSGGTLVAMRERFADKLQNGYFAFVRTDSVIDDSKAFKVLEQADGS